MQIEPDTEIRQTHFGSQTSLKACEVVRTFTSQAKGLQELVVDGFDDLPNARQPAAQSFGPADTLAGLMRGRDQVDLELGLPAPACSLSGKAEVFQIRAVSRLACPGQTRRGALASGQHGLGQVLIRRTGRAEAK